MENINSLRTKYCCRCRKRFDQIENTSDLQPFFQKKFQSSFANNLKNISFVLKIFSFLFFIM